MKEAAVTKIFVILCFLTAGRVNVLAIEPLKPCLSLEPAKVRLEGIIRREKFSDTGDPGEKAGICWILHFTNDVCVAKGDSDILDSDVTILETQLVFDNDGYKRYSHLVDKPVIATGKLFAAISAQHHTPVLLLVSTIEGADK